MGRKYYSGDAGYPTGWSGFKTLREQIHVFERMVQAEDGEGELIEDYLDGSHVERLAAKIQVPQNWDGIAVVPKPQKLAPLYRGQLKGFLYNQAYAHLIQIMVHHLDMRSDPGLAFGTYQTAACAELYQKLMAQPGDYMVFAAQLGMAHARRPVEKELDKLKIYEVPLDGYLAGAILLAHPNRLASVETSGIWCPGARLRQDPDRVQVLRKAGIQCNGNTFADVRLQIKHLMLLEPGWIATARIPGM